MRIVGFGVFGNFGSGDRLLELLVGELGEDVFWDKIGREEDMGDGVEVFWVDKICWG